MLAKSAYSTPIHSVHPSRRKQVASSPWVHQYVPLPQSNSTVAHAISISAPETRVPIPVPIPNPNIEHEHEHDESRTDFYDYQFLFYSQRLETPQPITLGLVNGAIPCDFPSGTYYLTGPGLFSDDHGSTVHPLDGHGYLRSFTIDNATRKVKYMAKYIKTEAKVEEHDPETDEWRFTHRGPFSVLKGGRKVGNTKVMKNVANTSVLMWGNRLLCMWEGGDPYEMESRTLDTIGTYTMMDGSDFQHCSLNPADVWEVAARLLKPILYGKYYLLVETNYKYN